MVWRWWRGYGGEANNVAATTTRRGEGTRREVATGAVGYRLPTSPQLLFSFFSFSSSCSIFFLKTSKKTSPFTTMILKATFLQQREASALTIRTEKMPIKKVKMEDKRKHHHFLSLGIGDDGDDNDEHCIYPSVYILAVTNNSHFDERKMRNVLSALDASFLRNLLGDH